MSDQSFISRTSGLKGKDYFGYALVDAAGCLVFSLVTTLLQKFYTDIFHLSPLFIMLMFIAARVWDAINDPIMGRICDTVKPAKSGRYKQWFLYVAFPLAVSAVLLFVKWPGIGEDGKAALTCVYATVTYILFGMIYTVLQIPYGSLASVVTTDDHERNKLSVYRSIGAALGSIPVLLIASFAYADRIDEAGNKVIGENGKVITDMQYKPVLIGVIAMAVCSALMLVLAFALNKERVKTKPQPKEKGAAKKAIGILFKNKAFITVSLVAMLLLAGQMFTQSFYTYLFDDYFHANWMNLASQACTYSPMIIMMFILPKAARKIGKKEVCAVGTAAAAAANLILFFLRGVDPSILMWIFLLLCFVSGCGLTTVVMQLWAMATDAIDDIEVSTGSRDDGTAYSFFNFFRKLGQVLAAVCVNGALLGMHYNYAKGAVQTLENLKKMYDMATVIPAVLFGLMALILFVWYPLSRNKVAELQTAKEAKLKEAYESNTIDI
ncbi:MAG: MFS transporter [Clostridia bacterium]|nr:MFS transporter [Clostridia bacterium]MBO7659784.1 MFS transporter [Clostridia bacterium]MBP5766641.1 MFS transporter [Clostridia bacterium]